MSEKTIKAEKISFLAGVLVTSITLLIIFLMAFYFLELGLGIRPRLKEIWNGTIPQSGTDQVLYIPDNILNELIEAEAVVDNANNPTKAKEHDTILVQPNEELGFTLRPSTNILAYILRTQKAYNIDPPVLYVKSSRDFSSPLRNYIDNQARLHYVYSIDENGFRTTLPRVRVRRKILIVGDSVAFGVGVNDDSTMASYLQTMIGESYSVINAGIGSYSARQAIQMANSLSQKNKYDVLIYLTSQNDMFGDSTYSANAEEILKEFATLKPQFPGGIIVVIFPYMEYSIHDILLEEGWDETAIDQSEALYIDLPLIANDVGVEYIDLTSIFDSYSELTGTVFSRFALYADHAHMSPLANQLTAEKVYESLKKQKLVP